MLLRAMALMRNILSRWWGFKLSVGVSQWWSFELSVGVSTRRARLSNAAKFDKNEWIFLHTLSRTGFETDFCGYCTLL